MSKLLVSIDPGIRATGVGVFEDKTLIASRYVYNSSSKGLGPQESYTMARQIKTWLQGAGYEFINVLAMEWPQVYPVSKGDPNDLLPLCGVDAALVALLDAPGLSVIHYLPMGWKGQLPKEVMCERIVQRLSPEERTLIHDVGHLTHNVIDSIGVGLHYLGRLNPKKVFAR